MRLPTQGSAVLRLSGLLEVTSRCSKPPLAPPSLDPKTAGLSHADSILMPAPEDSLGSMGASDRTPRWLSAARAFRGGWLEGVAELGRPAWEAGC